MNFRLTVTYYISRES